MDRCDPPDGPLNALSEEFVDAVSGLFECLGRALICLDRDFRIVHASEGLDSLVGDGVSEGIIGKPACHVRKPGSDKLTKKGKELADVVGSMEELRVWLDENHPEPKKD